jgi:hypothetical protein
MFLTRIALVISISVLGSCSTVVDEPVSRAYGEAVRDLGIFPVFPPREEFQVGDIYMWSQSLSDPSDTISVYITSLDWVRHEASNFLRSRVVFQNSAHNNTTARPLEQVDLPGTPGRITTRGEIDDATLLSSLPITALPRVSADAGYTTGLGIVGILASLGLAGSARTTVTLDFNDVRSYWVPNTQVRGRLQTDAALAIGPYFEAGQIELRRLVGATGRADPSPCSGQRRCGVSVITRVYLTREIDYTYRNGSIVAAGLRRADAVNAEGAAPRPPAAPSVVVNVATGSDGTVDGAQTQAQVNALRQQIDALSASNDRGASLRFEAWDARGITFSQLYQRPVAVAWDGIELNIALTDPTEADR